MYFLLTKPLKRKLKRVQPLLGTYVQIELQAEADESVLNDWITQGFKAIDAIDRLMSFHRSDSDLTRLNRAQPHLWVTVSGHTIGVLKVAEDLWCLSNGVFDIRCGKALAERGVLPAVEKSISYEENITIIPSLEINGLRVRKTGAWIMDLGGIAKGYAVDHAVQTIQQLAVGVQIDGIVNAGGDLRVWGDAATRIATRIDRVSASAVHPFDIHQTAVATSSVRIESMSCDVLAASAHVNMPSGDFLKEPKTVTVFAEECCIADALTKIVLLGSTDIAIRCLNRYKARALVFGSDGQIKETLD